MNTSHLNKVKKRASLATESLNMEQRLDLVPTPRINAADGQLGLYVGLPKTRLGTHPDSVACLWILCPNWATLSGLSGRGGTQSRSDLMCQGGLVPRAASCFSEVKGREDCEEGLGGRGTTIVM